MKQKIYLILTIILIFSISISTISNATSDFSLLPKTQERQVGLDNSKLQEAAERAENTQESTQQNQETEEQKGLWEQITDGVSKFTGAIVDWFTPNEEESQRAAEQTSSSSTTTQQSTQQSTQQTAQQTTQQATQQTTKTGNPLLDQAIEASKTNEERIKEATEKHVRPEEGVNPLLDQAIEASKTNEERIKEATEKNVRPEEGVNPLLNQAIEASKTNEERIKEATEKYVNPTITENETQKAEEARRSAEAEAARRQLEAMVNRSQSSSQGSETAQIIQTSSSSSGSFSGTTLDKIISSGDKFINAGINSDAGTIDDAEIKKASDTVWNVLMIVGIILAVVVGIILGIKFIIGSVEEQAKVKEMLVPYVVGCVVIFGSFTIWKIVVDILQAM